MKTKYIIWLILGIVIWIGCSDYNDVLTPSDTPEYEISLPQGEHAYDDRIVNWFERTGVYILYKFKPSDVYFNASYPWAEMYDDTTRILEWFPLGENVFVEDDVVHVDGEVYPLNIEVHLTNGSWVKYSVVDTLVRRAYTKIYYGGLFNSFRVNEAEETYVEKQLTLLEELFLNNYPDNVLRMYMPLKVILGCDLEVRKTQTHKEGKAFTHSYNNLILSYGNSAIDSLTMEERDTLGADLNVWFLSEMVGDSVLLDKFFSYTPYDYWVGYPEYLAPVESEYYSYGLIGLPEDGKSNLGAVKTYEQEAFIKMIISTPEEVLRAEPESGDYDPTSFKGILHEKKDKKGLINCKYNALLEAYLQIGMDLQAIGNRNR